MTCLGFLVPMAGEGSEFSEPLRKKAPCLGPRGASGSCDGGVGTDFSHTALNTKAKKIHKGSPLPEPPTPPPPSPPDPLMLLWLLQSPF